VAEEKAEAVGLNADGRTGRAKAWVAHLLDQDRDANKRLTLALAVMVGALVLASLPQLRASFPFGIDLEIPLRAAGHWSAGTAVYSPSAMQVQSGPDLPYLYPPFLLPFLAPIATLPREPVLDAWFGVCLVVAVWTCRRLGIPWPVIPALIVWPPFGEGLEVGNVQVLLFAAFVAVFYEQRSGLLEQRELRPSRDVWNGMLAVAVGALKVTQSLPLLYLARRRFRAAILGVVGVGAVVLATLPLTGVSIYWDWLAQLEKASDPAWTVGGMGLGHSLGIPGAVPAAIGIVLALAVRGRDSAAWLGIALVISTPSAHGYTFLFLLPALLTIRRDLAIPIGGLFLFYYTAPWWLASGLVVCLMIAAARRPQLRVPRPSPTPQRVPLPVPAELIQA
jgi:hypothetical protein